jgi:S1-C subfamily serine protease
MMQYKPGQSVALEVLRGTSKVSINLTLGTRPNS